MGRGDHAQLKEKAIMSSAERLIGALALFTSKRPAWTPEKAAQALGVSRASAYRYFLLLYEAGYIEADSGSGYTLGPRIVELDRQIRLSDPLVQTAVDEMVNLARKTGGVSLLCRLYRDRVLCVHQERGSRAPGLVSYERGRAMPLYRGATSKAILAFLPPRALNALVERDRSEVARAGLPADGAAVHEALAPVRERRLCISHGEVDPGAWGAAVPIIDNSGVIGSLSVVLPASVAKGGLAQSTCRLLVRAGQNIEAELEQAKSNTSKRRNTK